MNRERAAQAAAAGVDSVSVSIDGVGHTHDVQRGVIGSFDAAVQAMRNLREAGVPVSANSQINRLSFGDLDALLDLLIELGAHGWQLAMTVPMGRAAERPEWLMQPSDMLVVFPKLAELAERARRSGLRLTPGNNVGYYGPHEDTLRGHLTEALTGSYFQGCGAGVTTLGLEADGKVKGCPSLPTASYTGGHIRERSLLRIWEEAAELRFAREPRTEELWGFCRSCYYADVCQAGCSWTAHVFFGRRGNNPYCHHRALVHRDRGERERLTRLTDSPGDPFDHATWSLSVEPDAGDDAGWTVPASTSPRRKLRVVA